ncbi:MAG: hypothetical protein V3T53_11185 [Phycisphaerales bacterium]
MPSTIALLTQSSSTLQLGRGRVAALRYVNIETSGVWKRGPSASCLRRDAGRLEFRLHNEILDELGINCCDAAGKNAVKKDLAAAP